MIGPGAILLLGGTSDIGLAIVTELLAAERRPVLLAARATSPRLAKAKARVESAGATCVQVLDFDCTNFASHPGIIEQVFGPEHAPVAVAIVAFGLLGDAERLWHDQAAAVTVAQTNYTGAVSVGVALGEAFSRQGSGAIVAISSVAGEKVRRANFVYGSSKAGMDGFYRQLGVALEPAGVHVLVVRPGFVSSAMTAGRPRVPLTVSPATVAHRTVEALARGRTMIRVPAVFGLVMAVFKHLPDGLARRLRL